MVDSLNYHHLAITLSSDVAISTLPGDLGWKAEYNVAGHLSLRSPS